jgi:hypothetical protein
MERMVEPMYRRVMQRIHVSSTHHWCVLDSSGSEQVPLDVCCEHDRQTSAAIKSGDDVHYLNASHGSQIAVATTFCKVAPSICGFSVWNFLNFTIRKDGAWRALPNFFLVFFFVIVMCVPSSVFCVLFVCKCVLLPPGVNSIAVKLLLLLLLLLHLEF